MPERIKNRIEEPGSYRKHDKISITTSSEAGLLDFIGSPANVQDFRLLLMNNGDLRAVWSDNEDDKEHYLSIMFTSQDEVHYVLFKHSPADD